MQLLTMGVCNYWLWAYATIDYGRMQISIATCNLWCLLATIDYFNTSSLQIQIMPYFVCSTEKRQQIGFAVSPTAILSTCLSKWYPHLINNDHPALLHEYTCACMCPLPWQRTASAGTETTMQGGKYHNRMLTLWLSTWKPQHLLNRNLAKGLFCCRQRGTKFIIECPLEDPP